MKIFKYPLTVTDHQKVEMPKGAQILTVQMQGLSPCLWALVDEHAETEARNIRTVGTGHPIKPHEATRYIGSYQMGGGSLIFHVFDEVFSS